MERREISDESKLVKVGRERSEERERERDWNILGAGLLSALSSVWPVVYISNCCIRTEIIANTAKIFRLLLLCNEACSAVQGRTELQFVTPSWQYK